MEALLHKLQYPYGMGIFFVLGLMTSFHCVCMCGPISTVVFQTRKKSKNVFILYHATRAMVYGWIGFLLGLFKVTFQNIGLLRYWLVLWIIILLFISLGKVSFINKPLMKLQMTFSKLATNLSKNSRAFLLGLVTPLFPCGPLYAALASCILAPHPIESAAWMVSFALGTIPLMLLQQTTLTHLAQKLSNVSPILFYRWICLATAAMLIYIHFFQ